MQIRLKRIEKKAKNISFLSTKALSEFDGTKVCLSGWAYSPEGRDLKIIVRSGGTIFSTPLTKVRPDVERHLNTLGHKFSPGPKLGFNFSFLFSPGMEVGLESRDGVEWIYKLLLESKVDFRNFDSVEQLTDSSEGVCRNVYFHNAEDWSKVVVMFNGALTAAKVSAEKAIFQRWSWAKRFRHPVFCVADPLTVGESALVLGWYLGASGPNALPQTIGDIIEAVKRKNPDTRIVGFGSSAGGYAALGGAMLGLLDEAIVINPQTDALKSQSVNSLGKYLERRGSVPADSDLTKYEISALKDGAKICYLQNKSDFYHFDKHYQPFKEAFGFSDKFSFVEYDDPVAGHFPPGLESIQELVGAQFSSLIGS